MRHITIAKSHPHGHPPIGRNWKIMSCVNLIGQNKSQTWL